MERFPKELLKPAHGSPRDSSIASRICRACLHLQNLRGMPPGVSGKQQQNLIGIIPVARRTIATVSSKSILRRLRIRDGCITTLRKLRRRLLWGGKTSTRCNRGRRFCGCCSIQHLCDLQVISIRIRRGQTCYRWRGQHAFCIRHQQRFSKDDVLCALLDRPAVRSRFESPLRFRKTADALQVCVLRFCKFRDKIATLVSCKLPSRTCGSCATHGGL